jgi:hypothetical protein
MPSRIAVWLSTDFFWGATWGMSVNCNGGIFEMKKLAFAAALTVAFSGNAFAQTPSNNGPSGNGSLRPSVQIVGANSPSDPSRGAGSFNVIVGGCPGTCIPTVKGSMSFPVNADGLVTAFSQKNNIAFELTLLGFSYSIGVLATDVTLNGVKSTSSNRQSLLGANCSIVGSAETKIETVGNQINVHFTNPRFASVTCTK